MQPNERVTPDSPDGKDINHLIRVVLGTLAAATKGEGVIRRNQLVLAALSGALTVAFNNGIKREERLSAVADCFDLMKENVTKHMEENSS